MPPAAIWDGAALCYEQEATLLTGAHIRYSIGQLHPYLPSLSSSTSSPPSTPLRALDVAAGTGSASFILAEHGFHVTATDYSQGMVDLITHKAHRLDLSSTITATVMDATHLIVNVAVIAFVLFALPQLVEVVKAMMRAVKPGGLVVCVHLLSVEESQSHGC